MHMETGRVSSGCQKQQHKKAENRKVKNDEEEMFWVHIFPKRVLPPSLLSLVSPAPTARTPGWARCRSRRRWRRCRAPAAAGRPARRCSGPGRRSAAGLRSLGPRRRRSPGPPSPGETLRSPPDWPRNPPPVGERGVSQERSNCVPSEKKNTKSGECFLILVYNQVVEKSFARIIFRNCYLFFLIFLSNFSPGDLF